MKLLKFSIIFLSLLFISNFYLNVKTNALEPDRVVVKVITFFDEDNITETLLNIEYGNKLSLADDVLLDSDYAFSFWILNGTVLNYPLNHQFIIANQMELTAVFKPIDKIAATFIDSNGKVLKIDYITPGNNAVDDGIIYPNKPGYVIKENKWDKSLLNILSDTIITLQYEIDTTTKYNLNVIKGNGSNDYNYNEVVTITANTPEAGMYFSHWEENGCVVSNQSAYSFSILYNKTITAIYSNEESVDQPIITMSDDLFLRDQYNSYLLQFYLPNNYQLIEYGVITSLNNQIIDLTTEGVAAKQAHRYFSLTNEFIISLPYGSHISVRGYMSVKNPNGTIEYIYSENTFLMYNITFNSNGGSVVQSIYQAKDTVIAAPIAPTKEGYTFVDWYEDSSLTIPYIFDKMPDENIILYAMWDEIITEGLIFYEESDESYTITGYIGSSTEVFIPDFYLGFPVKRIGDGAFAYSDIISVKLPNGLIMIGSAAFYGCESLVSVNIPKGVLTIGWSVFQYCTSLKSIYFPPAIDEQSIIYGCTALESIDVDIDNIYFSSIDGVLFNKSKTQLLLYPPAKPDTTYIIPDGVTSIYEYAFENNCPILTSIFIPEAINYIPIYVFYNCTSLESINVDINNSIFSSVEGVLFNKDITWLLYYPRAKQDTNYSIPNSVTDLEISAISSTIFLTTIIIPNSITSIPMGAFCESVNLTNVIIPNSVTSIEEAAFLGCKNLTSIIIPNSVIYIEDYVFSGCPNLTIYCEAESKPAGWSNDWNCDNLEVVWNYGS